MLSRSAYFSLIFVLHLKYYIFINVFCISGRDDETKEKLGDYLYVYEIFVVIWIIFGLGYVFMIIGELMEGLRAPARKAAKKLRKAEKVILEKVLHEVVLIKSRVSNSLHNAHCLVLSFFPPI